MALSAVDRRRLLAAARQAKPARLAVPPSRGQLDRVREQYARPLEELAQEIGEEVERRFVRLLGSTLREDAGERDVARLARQLTEELERRVRAQAVERIVERAARDTDAWSRGVVEREVRTSLAISLPDGAETRSRLAAWSRENADLIVTLPRRHLAAVEEFSREALREGWSVERYVRTLRAEAGNSRSNARRIARDQVGKLNAQLTQDRHAALGIRAYFWRTVGDERVREEHQLLDGQRFLYAEPPAEGHPGTPIQCRCYAEPDFSDLDEQALADPDPALDPENPDDPSVPEELDQVAREIPRAAEPGVRVASRLVRDGIRDEQLDYLRDPSSLRDLRPFREAYAAAAREGISATEVASTGVYPGGKFPPIRIEVAHDGQAFLSDGRHRYRAAREAGAEAILGNVVVRGPRGGIVLRGERLVLRLR